IVASVIQNESPAGGHLRRERIKRFSGVHLTDGLGGPQHGRKKNSVILMCGRKIRIESDRPPKFRLGRRKIPVVIHVYEAETRMRFSEARIEIERSVRGSLGFRKSIVRREVVVVTHVGVAFAQT